MHAPPGTDPATGRRIPLARPGRGASQRRRAEILRVDHAGEYAAVHIYRAQRAVFEGRSGREAVAA
ncbi:MAG: demethoxyubiquinone hydroxylase family protein, partial [Phenylobacterium sp.]|nr:demethoxyubiquinone hydroxylase family protein [Phenylobacterium sp.]